MELTARDISTIQTDSRPGSRLKNVVLNVLRRKTEEKGLEKYSNDGFTPLLLAVHRGDQRESKRLLKAGANEHAISRRALVIKPGTVVREALPIHYAVKHGDKMVELLLSYKAAVNSPTSEKLTPLAIAVELMRDDVVETLLRHRADPNITDRHGQAPIHRAARNGDVNCLTLLVRTADLTLKYRGRMAVHMATDPDTKAFLRRTYMAGIVNSPWAVRNKISAVIQLIHLMGPPEVSGVAELTATLRGVGADDINAAVKGQTPLVRALTMGRLDMADVICRCRGVKVNADGGDAAIVVPGVEGRHARVAPLHVAASNDSLDGVRGLLERHADPNKRTGDGYTPVHMAVLARQSAAIPILAAGGADVNLKDNTGQTPLALAVRCLYVNSVRTLIGAGADVPRLLTAASRDAGLSSTASIDAINAILTDARHHVARAGAIEVQLKERETPAIPTFGVPAAEKIVAKYRDHRARLVDINKNITRAVSELCAVQPTKAEKLLQSANNLESNLPSDLVPSAAGFIAGLLIIADRMKKSNGLADIHSIQRCTETKVARPVHMAQIDTELQDGLRAVANAYEAVRSDDHSALRRNDNAMLAGVRCIDKLLDVAVDSNSSAAFCILVKKLSAADQPAALHRAMRSTDVLHRVLRDGPVWLNVDVVVDGATPLCRAVMERKIDTDVVSRLLAAGADPTAPQPDTCAFAAALRSNDRMAGGVLSLFRNRMTKLLNDAVDIQDERAIDRLVGLDTSLLAPDNAEPPLFLAIKRNRRHSAALLLELGADPRATYQRRTAIQRAVKRGAVMEAIVNAPRRAPPVMQPRQVHNDEATTDSTAVATGTITCSRVIGQGSCAVVWAGVYMYSECAVKAVDLTHLTQARVDRLRYEISVHRSLQHANIVQFFALEEGPTQFLIALGLAAGSLANTLLSPGEIDWGARMTYTRDIAAALKFLHTMGYEHRDLKAANVLVNNGHALLTDFGLTLRLDNPDAAALVEGSWPWMAPERFTGASGTACDVFSFGMTMWEIAARDIPYRTEGYTVDGIEAFVGAGRRLPVPYDTPKRFAEVMVACLAPNPDDRPSIDAILEALSPTPATPLAPGAVHPGWRSSDTFSAADAPDLGPVNDEAQAQEPLTPGPIDLTGTVRHAMAPSATRLMDMRPEEVTRAREGMAGIVETRRATRVSVNYS